MSWELILLIARSRSGHCSVVDGVIFYRTRRQDCMHIDNVTALIYAAAGRFADCANDVDGQRVNYK